MDAAHNFKKLALFLAPALLLAANAFGQQLQVSQTTVQLVNDQPVSVTVSSSTSTAITFNISQSTTPAPNFMSLPATGNTGTTGTTLTFSVNNTGCLNGSTSNPKSCTATVTLTDQANSSDKATITVTYTPASSGTGVITPNQTSVTLNAPSGGTTSQIVTLTTLSPTPISFSSFANQTFLTVSQSSNTVSASFPATLTISNIAQTNGQYSGSITVSPVGGTPITINVTVNQGTGTSGTITASPNPAFLSFPGTQSLCVQVNATNGTLFTAQANSAGWLAVNNGSASQSNLTVGNCGLFLQLTSVASTLATNIYQGSVLLTNQADATTTTLSVTLSVNGGSNVSGFSATPSSLSFPSGGNPQTVNISCNTCSANTFVASPQTDSGGAWLAVQNSGIAQNLPANLIVSVSTGSLGSGTYTGRINVQTSNGTAQIPVTLTVGGGGGTTGGIAAPTALNFSYQAGSSISPPQQFILVNGTGTINISNVQQGSTPFFNAGAVGGAPGRVLVSVQNLQNVGTYTGGFTISDDQGSQNVTVTLTVYGGPTLMDSAGTVTCFFSPGQPCTPTTVQFVASDGSSMPFTVTSSASYVTLVCTDTKTPAACRVAIDGSTLPNGLNTATLNVTGAGAANASYSIPVVVLVSGSTGGGGGLTLSASSFSFSAVAGGSAPANQTLTVSASTATSFTANVSSPSSCSWLSISPSGSLTTNSTITISVNQAGLTANTYTCNIALSSSVSGTQVIPVTLTVTGSGTGGNVTASPTSLSFSTQAGNSPAAQQINVSSASGSAGITFTASATTSSGGNWLSVNFATAITPVALTISVNSGNLQAGTYNGSITISPTGGTQVSVPVTLTVTPAVSITASPTSLTFSYSAGGALPTAQQIQVSGNGGALGFTATSSTSWLLVTPTNGTTPASGTTPLTVSIDPTNLNVNQTYNGTITVAGAGGASGSTTVNVTLNITAPLPTITSVTNAASFNTGGIAAGEVISIFGSAMGPTTGVSFQLDSNGKVPTTVGGVQVLVGGYPAPVLFARNDQVSAIVPYEINSPFIASPSVVVKFLGQSSNGIPLSQVASAPGIFTANSSGSGPGAILNANLSTNTPGNPANKGDIIAIYMTGEGQTNPPGVTGKITGPPTIVNGVPFTPQPVGRVAVTIDGQPANIVFYGEAPGIVSGVMQVNVQIPTNARSGDLPIVVTVGNANSQTDSRGIGSVTVSVK